MGFVASFLPDHYHLLGGLEIARFQSVDIDTVGGSSPRIIPAHLFSGLTVTFKLVQLTGACHTFS
jgi:hypothetical protein